MAEAQGVGHVALSVTDVERSAAWYERIFGTTRAFEDRGDQAHIVLIMVGATAVGLIRKATDAGDGFDEFRTGLDHLAFAVGSQADVEAWKSHLDANDVANSGVISDQFGHHLNFRDPDNIALEIFAAAG